jgi:hypothetical protein
MPVAQHPRLVNRDPAESDIVVHLVEHALPFANQEIVLERLQADVGGMQGAQRRAHRMLVIDERVVEIDQDCRGPICLSSRRTPAPVNSGSREKRPCVDVKASHTSPNDGACGSRSDGIHFA